MANSVLAQRLVVGTIGSKYELRYAGKGNDKTAVIDFSVAVTARKLENNEWVDGKTVWINATAWRRLAENIDKSFRKGDRVILWGHDEFKAGYTKQDGTEVPDGTQFVVDNAGVDIAFQPAHSERVAKDEGSTQRRSSNNSARPAAAPAAAPEVDSFNDSESDLPF